MRDYKRWVLLGTLAALSLLAGALAPVSILAETVPLSISTPDLTVEMVTWSPEIPLVGDTVTFTLTIKNQGSSQAGSSRVAYYIDDTYQASTHVNQINPGDTATRTFAWTAQAGSHAIKAVTDSDMSVTESDETNNEKVFAFSVVAPDLVIDTITWSPENPSIGDQVTFMVTVKNEGNSKALYSQVDLFIKGNSRGCKEILKIDAGANVTQTFTWEALAGSYDVKAVADVLNQVKESHENNDSSRCQRRREEACKFTEAEAEGLSKTGFFTLRKLQR